MEVLRRTASEPAMFLGGQRALLLQLAHPLVAAGVEHHSGFRAAPVRRLWSTIDALMCLVWGRPDEATSARARILGIHDRVHGVLAADEATPAHPTGTPYTAHDPELLWWVWATLVDTTEVVHERFLRPLDEPTLDALYADWCELARFVGIPPDLLDADRPTFVGRYLGERDGLALSPAARRVAGSVLDPPVRLAPRTVTRAYALLATGLLDDRTRHLYGLPWSAEHVAAYERLERQIRASWELVPEWRRELPTAYLAVRRPVVTTGRSLVATRSRASELLVSGRPRRETPPAPRAMLRRWWT